MATKYESVEIYNETGDVWQEIYYWADGTRYSRGWCVLVTDKEQDLYTKEHHYYVDLAEHGHKGWMALVSPEEDLGGVHGWLGVDLEQLPEENSPEDADEKLKSLPRHGEWDKAVEEYELDNYLDEHCRYVVNYAVLRQYWTETGWQAPDDLGHRDHYHTLDEAMSEAEDSEWEIPDGQVECEADDAHTRWTVYGMVEDADGNVLWMDEDAAHRYFYTRSTPEV
jgi:hypothetical protein